MGAFAGLKQAELRAECDKRELAWAPNETNASLEARLDAFEEATLLGDDPQPEPAPAEPEPAPATADPPAAPVVSPDAAPPLPPIADAAPPLPPQKPRIYKAAFPAPDGDVTTEQNIHYRGLAFSEAIAEGHTPRGGLAGVSRVGWTAVDGVRHAVYEVPLRH